MTMVVGRKRTRQDKYLIIIGTARLRLDDRSVAIKTVGMVNDTLFTMVGMSAAAMAFLSFRAAGFGTADMLGMNVLTGQALNEGSHKASSASAACVHIKTYDTHRVPYSKQHCHDLYEHITHHCLQNYKNYAHIITIFSKNFFETVFISTFGFLLKNGT